VWFETHKIAATAADIVAMTKLVLERALVIEQGQITECAPARIITRGDERADLPGPLTQERAGAATLVAEAPESCFPAEEDPEIAKARALSAGSSRSTAGLSGASATTMVISRTPSSRSSTGQQIRPRGSPCSSAM
jgi:hypothetical protein